MGADVACLARPYVRMVAVLIVLSCPAEGRADPPSCPATEATQPLPPKTFSVPHTAQDIPIDPPQHPCETFSAQVSATVPYQAGVTVEFVNASGVVVADNGSGCYGSCSFGVPYPGYAPWRGTSGPFALVTTIRVRAGFLIGPPPLQVTVTLTRTPRPSYNLGGATLPSAPRIGPLPRTVYGSCHQNAAETGQYYKVRLVGSGTLSVSGTAQGGLPYGGWLYVDVYTAGQTLAQNIINGAGILTTGTPFSSATFTNPSPQPAVFYVRVSCGLNGLWAFTMTITGVEDQTATALSLYLDADGNFDPLQPDTDAEWYLPGSLPDGTSIPPLALPQIVAVIAAFTDPDGVIVPPPPGHSSATFALGSTTSHPGVAMNSGSETTADFDLTAGTAPFSPADHTARVTLRAQDYAGATTLAITTGSWLVVQDVPVDTDLNGLPDTGWDTFERVFDEQAQDFVFNHLEAVPDAGNPGDDLDSVPEGYGVSGDNLTRFEEYRGFVIRGQHYRTSPFTKDVFVHHHIVGGDWLEDAKGVQLRWHEPAAADISASRRINFNSAGTPGQTGHIDQQAILVFDAGENPDGNQGGSVPCDPVAVPFICYPNIIGSVYSPPFDNWSVINNVKIFEATVRRLSPPNPSPLTPDMIDAEGFRSIRGHELGHAVSVDHNLSDPTSIMTPDFNWQMINHLFWPANRSQVRVK
jgi:hypothetical protein